MDHDNFGGLLLLVLEHSKADFRTTASLAVQLRVSEERICDEIEQLGDLVRRPVGQENRYPNWHRLTSKGLTRREKWSRIRAIVTFTPMQDGF